MKVKSRFGHLNQEFEIGDVIYVAQNSQLKEINVHQSKRKVSLSF
jgi:hypothetical protein